LNGLPCNDGIKASKGKDPVVIKTHHPFLYNKNHEQLNDISIIVKTIRNPLDNYDAWKRYLKGRNPSYSCKHFIDDWVQHHTFWWNISTTKCIPIYEYRYEDLLESPSQEIISFLNKTDFYHLPSFDPKGADDIKINEHQIAGCYFATNCPCKYMCSKDDIKYMLDTYLSILKQYGYDKLLQNIKKRLSNLESFDILKQSSFKKN